jgi:DNA relaxase NicK
MQDQGYGGRLYGKIYKALVEAKIYCTPKLASTEDGNSGHFHIELPGTACAALPAKLIQEFVITLIRYEKFQVTRLDLAWDGVPFTPDDLDKADKQDLFRTYARRSTFRFERSRHDEREDGTVGHSIFRMGSRQSSRHMRVYDYHGPVRLELECRAKRADLIARDVLPNSPDKWSDLAIPHLRDFLDIEAEYWEKFVQDHARASRTIVDVRTEEIGRIAWWMYKQVAPSLSVLADLYGEGVLRDIVDDGRKRRGRRFESILNYVPGQNKEGRNE